MKIEYGKLEGAKSVTLTNKTGMSITFGALGAGIASIKVPDRDGVSREVTRLSDKGYAKEYHGLTIGRTSGRIENATFTVDGKTAKLEVNNHGVDNLHGGKEGFHGKVFSLDIAEGKEYTDAVFKYTSPDGEGGYFGKVDLTVTYRVYENENKFELMFDATPDCKTLLNLTNHVYLNMSGDLRDPVSVQEVYINAPKVGVLDERLILREVADVPKEFDFRTPHKMGEYVESEIVQRYTHGYDHPFFLAERGTDKIACSLYSERSGIKLEVSTTYPCVVVYGDNFGGYKSTCFECQYNPDGIHYSPDDCGVCDKAHPYSEKTVYKFTVQ